MQEQLKFIPYLFLMIGISAIIGGAMALVIVNMGDTIDQCYNTSYYDNYSSSYCKGLNGTDPGGNAGSDNLNLSEEYYILLQGQEGIGTIAEQLPTLSIIAVMVIIIGLITTVFVYFQYFK